ncbi:hypothetical protein BH24ACT3_BH24ACT3_14220 [soil metagenome]
MRSAQSFIGMIEARLETTGTEVAPLRSGEVEQRHR